MYIVFVSDGLLLTTVLVQLRRLVNFPFVVIGKYIYTVSKKTTNDIIRS